MLARVTHVQMGVDKIDQAISIYRDSVVAAIKAQKGYVATYMLMDRATGKGMAMSIWETAEDLQASESSGFYNEQVGKFGPLLTAPPVREVYEVGVQA